MGKALAFRTKVMGRLRAPASPPPSVPTADLDYWLRVTDLAPGRPTVLTDAGPLSRAPALFGTNVPALVVDNDINGLPSLYFDKNDPSYSQGYQFTWDTTPTDGHLYAVVKVDSETQPDGSDTSHFLGSGTGSGNLYPWSSGVVYDDFCRDDRIQFNPTADLAAWHILSIKATAADWIASVNGAVEHSAGAGTRAWRANVLIGTNLVGYWFRGKIAEMLVYKTAHSAPDEATVLGYLSDRFAIAV
jgi:hypothetical protein